MEKATYIIDLRDAFSPKLAKASGNLDQFESKLKKVGGTNGSGGMLGEFGAAFGRFIGPAAIATTFALATAKLVTMGAELEMVKTQLEVLVGDVGRANQLFNEMTDMAIATPFATSDIVDSGKLLLSFGADVKDVMPTLSMLGDVAQGDANKMHLITLAFAQMSSTGRLMGQDLLQMINAGFNPLQVMAKELGLKDLTLLKKRMEEGAISAQMVKEAFIIATSEGGRFFGMMDKQANTMKGSWAAFTGEVEHFFAEAGLKTAPAVIKVINFMSEGFHLLSRVDFTPFVATFTQIGDLFSSLFDQIKDVFAIFGATTDSMTAMQMVFNLLAISIRTALTPIRMLIEGFKLLLMLGDSLIDVLKGVGLMLAGILAKDISLFKAGMDMTVKSAKEGFDSLFEEVKKFGQAEFEGWKSAFTLGTPEEEKARSEMQRFGRTKGVFDELKTGAAGKGKKSGVDGEVRSGGVKNITINITQLVGEINFEKLDNMNETRVVEIVKRALLTAVNDANVAVS